MASSGNFCNLNPLTENDADMNNGTYSVGNTKYVSSGDDGFVANMRMTAKSYCEVRVDALSNYGGTIGFRSASNAQSSTWDSVTFQFGYNSGLIYHTKGSSDQGSSGDIGGTVSAGAIVMMAYDPATYKWWVGVNGTWRNSGDPAAGSGQVFTGSSSMFENMSDITWGGWKGGANGFTGSFNFGQDSTFGGQETAGGNADANGFGDFKYSVPTGFLATCSGNMVLSDDIDPAQTDSDYAGGKQFNAVLYTGNGGAQSVTGFGFKPDLVWVKRRNATQSHRLADSTRGAKTLYPDSDIDEDDMAISYTADGFDWGTGTGAANNANASGGTYVAWGWKANASTTASNTTGGTNSVTQANTKTGFSIITYTGFAGSSGSSTVGHGMSVAPEFIIHKSRTRSSGWWCQHTGLTNAGYFIDLSGTGGQSDLSSYGTMNAPSTSVFTINGVDGIGGESANYVAYAWANLDGMQKFGKYEGNGNADGPFIYTGFRPRFVFVKNIDASQHWVSHDSARETFNPMDTPIDLDEAYAEYTSSNRAIDFLSNGFKCRTSDGEINSAQTFIYGAWADVPFKYNNTF